MIYKNKIPELIGMINSVIEKSRGALSEDEVQAMEKTIAVLKKLEEAEPSDLKEQLGKITGNLLKVLMKPEVIVQLLKLFND